MTYLGCVYASVYCGKGALATAEGIDVSKERIMLTRVFVPTEFRCKGFGTQLMQTVCDRADTDETELILMPLSYNESVFPTKLLRLWYMKFDFEESGQSYLIRFPK